MANFPDDSTQCPCGGGNFGDCCAPLLTGQAKARTAEALMRSRYSAYDLQDAGYLWRTWHPSTRPEQVLPTGYVWFGLRIIETVAGMPGDETGIVEYEATYRDGARSQVLHERAKFEYRASRWLYLEGIDN